MLRLALRVLPGFCLVLLSAGCTARAGTQGYPAAADDDGGDTDHAVDEDAASSPPASGSDAASAATGSTCGGKNQLCCPGDVCNDGGACVNGFCELGCGGPGQICCADDTCGSPFACVNGLCPSCKVDPSVSCGSATGVSCTPGGNPQGPGNLACTSATQDPATGNDVYCCIDWQMLASVGSGNCLPDDELSFEGLMLCPDPSTYGFDCDADPNLYDSSLSCTEVDGVPESDWCCTLH